MKGQTCFPVGLPGGCQLSKFKGRCAAAIKNLEGYASNWHAKTVLREKAQKQLYCLQEAMLLIEKNAACRDSLRTVENGSEESAGQKC